jgi:endoglucanase
MFKKHRFAANQRFFLLTSALTVLSAAFFSAYPDTRNITTMQLVKDMGLGLNLGNTFEAVIVCDPGDQGCENWVNGMETLETGWGSPVITEAMIKGYANAGFKTVRIPVAWSNKMTGNYSGGNYTISPALLNRVATVVNYVLDNGMYAIVNIHWDGGWWENFPTDSAECMKKYMSIWTQVSNHFKDYSDYLVFESLNEEGVWQKVWNRYDNSGNKARAFGLLNAINQTFTNLIRSSSGNNPERHLLIAGYATDINLTCDAAFQMPTDPKNRRAVSVHYYDPFGFTHLSQNESWADMLDTWGTQSDYSELNDYMNKMKTNFVDKGIPVIIGEYGFACSERVRQQSEIRKYTLAVADASYSRNMCPVLWDVQFSDNQTFYYYNRKTASFVDQALVTGFKAIVPTTAAGDKIHSGKAAAQRPQVAVRGRTLSVSSFGTDVTVRMIDVKGKVRANFRANRNASFSVGKIPAGRYLIEVKSAGLTQRAAAVILK